ncbi:hypothetical protein BJ742DRAFT_736293 [Cladochytrium replicatum]|nr:hypothetical protein BJ742DRAFT_736293 [Cladochytrium replicatum]
MEAVRLDQAKNIPLPDNYNFDDVNEARYNEDASVRLPPLTLGDLVEVRRHNRSMIGILIQVPSRRKTISSSPYRTVLSSGHVMEHRDSDVLFQVPGWAFEPQLASLARPGAAFSSTPVGLQSSDLNLLQKLEIPITALDHLNVIPARAEQLKDKMSGKFAQVHSHFASSIGTRRVATLRDVAAYVFGSLDVANYKPTAAELLAAHTFMYRSPSFVADGRNVRYTRLYGILSTDEVEKLNWLRNQLTDMEETAIRSEPRTTHLDAFLQKCRSLIEWRRDLLKRAKLAANLGSGDDSIPEPLGSPEVFDPPAPKVEFTGTDHIFIESILQLVASPANWPNPLKPLVLDGIIRMLQPLYPPMLQEHHAAQLLKEIGVWSSWENIGLIKAIRSFNAGGGREDRSDISVEGAGFNSSEDGAEMDLEGFSPFADRMMQIAEEHAQRLLQIPAFDNQESASAPVSDYQDPSSAQQAKKAVRNLLDAKPAVADCFLAPSDINEMEADFYRRDPCEAIRQDFGDMPVYVIDSPSAHELDDGISIERVQGSETKDAWIHVHIADPTAYIPPSHPLSLTSQLRGTSIYLSERHYPMMPEILSRARFDLGSSKLAMTFSGLLDGQTGELKDVKICPSMIHNIQHINYDKVDTVLNTDGVFGINMPEQSRMPWVSRGLQWLETIRSQSVNLNTRAVDELHEIHDIVSAHFRTRVANGAFQGDDPNISISLTPYPIPPYPVLPVEPQQLRTSPTVTINPNSATHLSPSNKLVSESMIIAGRVASAFCIRHDIAVPFRGQPSIVDAALMQGQVEPDEELSDIDLPVFRVDPTNMYPSIKTTLLPLLDRVMGLRDPGTGIVPFRNFREILMYMPPATASLRPVGHYSMGLPGVSHSDLSRGPDSEMSSYVKVTSPLRRYKDMIAHWQIKAHLLHKWSGSTSSTAQPLYPFKRENMALALERLRLLEKRSRVLSRRDTRYWTLEWIRRREAGAASGVKDEWDGCSPLAMASKGWWDVRSGTPYKGRYEPTLSPVYTGVVESASETGRIGTILLVEAGIGARVDTNISAQDRPYSVGDVVKCAVTMVDPLRSSVTVMLLRS